MTFHTQHVYSTLQQRENGRFHVISAWNTRGVFVGKAVVILDLFTINSNPGKNEKVLSYL